MDKWILVWTLGYLFSIPNTILSYCSKVFRSSFSWLLSPLAIPATIRCVRAYVYVCVSFQTYVCVCVCMSFQTFWHYQVSFYNMASKQQSPTMLTSLSTPARRQYFNIREDLKVVHLVPSSGHLSA